MGSKLKKWRTGGYLPLPPTSLGESRQRLRKTLFEEWRQRHEGLWASRLCQSLLLESKRLSETLQTLSESLVTHTKNHRSFLQKSPIKMTIFCTRDLWSLDSSESLRLCLKSEDRGSEGLCLKSADRGSEGLGLTVETWESTMGWLWLVGSIKS